MEQQRPKVVSGPRRLARPTRRSGRRALRALPTRQPDHLEPGRLPVCAANPGGSFAKPARRLRVDRLLPSQTRLDELWRHHQDQHRKVAASKRHTGGGEVTIYYPLYIRRIFYFKIFFPKLQNKNVKFLGLRFIETF